jgi:Na+-driven multidrug efflux pump
MVSSLVAMGTIALFRFPIVGLLTQDPEIIGITSTLLLWSVILEIGRPINLVVISGLKGAGDVRFPVAVGILMMWGISVTGAWFMGVYLAWGMTGIWLGRMLDEWLRGFVMIWRWSSRRWEGRSFVQSSSEKN